MLIRFSLIAILFFLLRSLAFCDNPPINNEKISIHIKQPLINKNWYNQKTFTSKDDLVIEVKGKLCDENNDGLVGSYRRSRKKTGNNLEYVFYLAKLINQGNGYCLEKCITGSDSVGISEAWFVNYEFNDGCYHANEIHFDDQKETGWIGESGDDGPSGNIFISKDRSLLLKM